MSRSASFNELTAKLDIDILVYQIKFRGKNLTWLSERVGWHKKSLANLINKIKRARMEGGDYEVQLSTIALLAWALGIPNTKLIAGPDPFGDNIPT